jgi:bacterioferritin
VLNRDKSIELLNKAIAEEMSAGHQYMYFHFHCDDQGYDMLAGIFKKTAIEEMIHIEHLAERVLFLNGEIEMTAAHPVEKITNIKDMLEFATKSEEEAILMYNNFANECAKAADSATKKLFEGLVADEERHYDQFDNEMENLEKFGDRYLALQSVERGKSIATMPPNKPTIGE